METMTTQSRTTTHEEAVIRAFVVHNKRERGEARSRVSTNVYQLLRSKGAGETCWAISEDSAIDGRELELRIALEKIMGSGMGTILSCIPGKLALFEGEDETLLLERA